jgi:hypothetical protein
MLRADRASDLRSTGDRAGGNGVALVMMAASPANDAHALRSMRI